MLILFALISPIFLFHQVIIIHVHQLKHLAGNERRFMLIDITNATASVALACTAGERSKKNFANTVNCKTVQHLIYSYLELLEVVF